MLIGDLDYPVAEAVIFFVLILSLVFNTFLFYRGEGNYSIKYQLMRNPEFFRRNIIATYIIQGIYKFFFVLPFLLLITLSILAAIRDINNLGPILINGLIILLLLYPIKNNFFYYRLFVIWLLTVGSQLSTFFIYQRNGEQAYLILSSIFYTANVLFFYLAIISIQQVYWEISQGIEIVKQQVVEINSRWAEGKLPKIFDGGLYGFLSKNKNFRYTQYLILYLISLLFLVAYALIVHYILGSSLGYVGLVSTVIYDIFIQIFNSLDHPGRSTKTVYYVLLVSRLLSFVFGLQNWILGYCVLYFFVSIFIGWIIIDKHLPLKQQARAKQTSNNSIKFMNALKTPQFVLIVLTIQIIIMLLVEAYALNETADPTIVYNNVTIPIWQWGILVLVAAWVVIIYMISVRVFIRYRFKIFSTINYYFGIHQLTEYHLYVFLSYLLLIALGVYSYLYLQQKIALISLVFIPLIYVCFTAIGVAWGKNNYKILADIEEYNKQMQKKFEIAKKRNQLIENNEKLKNYKKQMMMTNYRMKNTNFSKTSLKEIMSKKQDKLQEADVVIDDTMGKNMGEHSGMNITSLPSILQRLEGSDNKIAQPAEKDQQTYEPLKDWRNPENEVQCSQIWSCMTPNDKKIVINFIVFLLLWVGYCLASMIWCQSKFAISFFVCVIVLLSLFPYAKFYQTREDMLIQQIVFNWLMFAVGIAYWSVFDYEVAGPIAFSVSYLILAMYLIIKCYQTQFQIKVIINLIIQILLCVVFIEITLSIYKTIVEAVVAGLVFFILLILQIPVYFYLAQEHVPKVVIGICSGLIGSVIITISILGYLFHVLSPFAIFAIIMFLIFIAFFLAALAIYSQKLRHLQQRPNVYSAYGEPRYYFDSAKQVLKTNNIHINLFSGSMVTLVIFSVVVSIFFVLKQWAVFGLSLFWLMDFFISMQSAMSSYLTIGQYKNKGLLTNQLIKESLMKLKNYYMSQQIAGDDSPQFERLLEEAKQKVAQNGNADAEDYRKIVQYHDLYIKNLKEQERFLFFWIALIMFNLTAKKRENIFKTLNELKNIKEELMENGIILLSLEQQHLQAQERYEKVTQQIQSLQPIDFLIYEQILEGHRAYQKKKQQQAQEIHKKQQQQNARRNEELYNQMNNLSNLSQSDQIKIFKQKIKSRKLFIDKQFPAEDESLGQLSSLVKKWKRPQSDYQQLIKGGISADDVRQGNIGDCYLISSFAVLGQQRIKQTLGYDKNGNQLWVNQKGAYMVRFFKFSKQVYIIIDDLLPVDENQNWVFARSQQPNQFWPCILEKAYAKMYGGYQNIIEGKNHQVFAEFTGGFPYEIVIEKKNSNKYGLWDKLLTSIKNGYLLAAGSNASARGDADKSKRGIVQGHAYSILDVKQIDKVKLIKLKNPHGSLGVQWKGEYCDGSAQMNKRMISLLGHREGTDGIFWMTFQDFVFQFSSVYFCAVFDQRWIKFGPIEGQWKKNVNSFGTPDYQGIENNYHFGIRVTKKCNLFVCLIQESISALKGKNAIFMLLMKNEGKRLHKQSLDLLNSVTRIKRPTNSVSISLEAELESFSFPYTFTLMISCSEPDLEGKFNLVAYCDDKDAQIIQDSKFDIEK